MQRYTEAFERLAAWQQRPLFGISRAEVSAQFQDIMTNRGPTAAAQTFRFFRMVWNFAAAADEHAPLSPTVVLKAQKLWPKARRRQRVVSEKDFPLWWQTLAQLKAEWALYGHGLALTGCRRSEWINLKWLDVQLGKQLIVLPPEITKGNRELELPIGPELTRRLRVLKKSQVGSREYVFSHADGSRFEHAGNVIRRHREKTGIQWSPHDLRRVFLTLADDLNIPPAVQKALVNHAPGDVTEGYQIPPLKTRRAAMLKLEQAILARAGVAHV